MSLKIDWASHKAAKYACENWHYSKSVPSGKLVKIGVWENERFVGVVIFSRGASSNMLTPYNLKQDRGCELSRVALTSHDTPVSRIISIALSMLKKICPNLELIVSYADPKYGHHGGIYQALGWIYTGTSQQSFEYIKDGKRWHSRQVSEKGYNKQFGAYKKTLKVSECEKVKLPGKHRYLLPLTNNIKDFIRPMAKQYPKRVKQAMSDNQSLQRQGSADLHAPVVINIKNRNI